MQGITHNRVIRCATAHSGKGQVWGGRESSSSQTDKKTDTQTHEQTDRQDSFVSSRITVAAFQSAGYTRATRNRSLAKYTSDEQSADRSMCALEKNSPATTRPKPQHFFRHSPHVGLPAASGQEPPPPPPQTHIRTSITILNTS